MKTHKRKPQTTELGPAKKAPVIDLPSHPDQAQQVARLLVRHGVMRADDRPEEAANRLAAMALMLSNIAAAHLTGEADGIEADLGTGFAVEGGFLPADIETTVIAPAFRFQEEWERNLLHQVPDGIPGKKGHNPRKKGSPLYGDALFLPAEQSKRFFQAIQKQQMETVQRKAEEAQRAAEEKAARRASVPQFGSQLKQNAPEEPQVEIPTEGCGMMILKHRDQTRFRETLEYPVFIAEAGKGFEKHVTQAHRGRFVLHAKIDSTSGLERIGKTLGDFMQRCNVQSGDTTISLRADAVLCVGPQVLEEALMSRSKRATLPGRLLWLVESAAGYDLHDAGEVNDVAQARPSNFRQALDHEIGRRMDFSNQDLHELPALSGLLAGWRKFLREREQHCPGISVAVQNLPYALCYGLQALRHHRENADGAEVMALAKWLVMRMTNRMAVASSSGRNGRIERLAPKIAGKLLEAGPLDVRGLERKSHRLYADECNEALQILAEDGIVARDGNKWSIRSDTEAGRELLATAMNPKTNHKTLTC